VSVLILYIVIILFDYLIDRGDEETDLTINISNAEYSISHIVVPGGKLRSFEGESKTEVRIGLTASDVSIIDASNDDEGGSTIVKFVNVSLAYNYVEGKDYCFIKFSSISGSVIMEDVDLYSAGADNGKRHPGCCVKIISGCGVFTHVLFKDISSKRGSLIELEGGPLHVDSCDFTGIIGGVDGNTVDGGVLHASMNK
jgi:hypothetical protein